VTKKYQFDRLHWNGRSKFEEFGQVVREEIVPGTNVIFVIVLFPNAQLDSVKLSSLYCWIKIAKKMVAMD
jgi:hypothetical protein